MTTTSVLARPPALGLAGITLVVPVALLLALGAGGAEPSLLVLAPLSTFGLPVIAMIAFWWEDWPGSSLRRQAWSGWIDTLLVIAGAVVLTMVGQAIAERFDLRGVFDPTPGAGHAPTFPATMPLAAAAFVAMLELTLVTEGWPLRRLGRLTSGVAALVVSWGIGLAVYALIDRTGALAGAMFGALLVSIGVWQVVLFVVLQGWPLSELPGKAARLVCANAIVIGGGWLTYVALYRLAGWRPATISAAGGAIVAGALLVGMLFEGWPGIEDARGRALTLASVAAVAAVLYVALTAYADGLHWTRGEPEDWVAHAGLNAIGAGVILHVAVGKRWPFG
jgi:hypothetical protein